MSLETEVITYLHSQPDAVSLNITQSMFDLICSENPDLWIERQIGGVPVAIVKQTESGDAWEAVNARR
jgi:hypothetical protein